MSTKLKLLQKALQKPHHVSFKEFDALLRHFGFVRVKTNAGSHFKWEHVETGIKFLAPYRRRVKSFYVKRLTQIIRKLIQSQ